MPAIALLLALAAPATAQQTTLEADPYAAALSCNAAAGTQPDLKGVERLAVGMHFVMLASRHKYGPTSLVDRYPEMAPAARARAIELGKDAAELLPQCRQRFPAAWVSTPAPLPTGTFQRKLLCATAAGLLSGAFSTIEGTAEETAWFASLKRRFRPLMTEADLKANGLTTIQKIGPAMGAAVDPTLDQGNILGVVRACDAAFPG